MRSGAVKKKKMIEGGKFQEGSGEELATEPGPPLTTAYVAQTLNPML